jgi:hypothetical protein
MSNKNSKNALNFHMKIATGKIRYWDNDLLSACYMTIVSVHRGIHVSEYLNNSDKNVKHNIFPAICIQYF